MKSIQSPVAACGADVQHAWRLAQPALRQRASPRRGAPADRAAAEPPHDGRGARRRAIADDDHLERDALLRQERGGPMPRWPRLRRAPGRSPRRARRPQAGIRRKRVQGGSGCAQRWWNSIDAAMAAKSSGDRGEGRRGEPRIRGERHGGPQVRRRARRAASDAVVYGALLLQEGDRAGHLVEAVDAVLDRDPAVEADAGEDAEDGVVVVQALAGLAVLQLAPSSRRRRPPRSGRRAWRRARGSDRRRASRPRDASPSRGTRPGRSRRPWRSTGRTARRRRASRCAR